MKKYCVFKRCKNHDTSKKKEMDGVFFLRVPKPSMGIEKCQQWISAINRNDITVLNVKNHHFVCSKHFIGGNGPTAIFPDPIRETEIPKFQILQKFREHNYAAISADVVSPKSEIQEDEQNCILLQNEKDLHHRNFDGNQHLEELDATKISENSEAMIIDDQNLESSNVVMEASIPEYYQPEQPVNKESCSFETLTKEFLLHQVKNLKSALWYLKLKNSPGLASDNLIFEKQITEKICLRINISPAMKIVFSTCDTDLNEDHEIYASPTFLKIPIESVNDLLHIMNEVDKWKVCHGLSGDIMDKFQNQQLKSALYCKKGDLLRSQKCTLLFKSTKATVCSSCSKARRSLKKRIRREKDIQKPRSNKGSLKSRLAAMRIKNLALKRRVRRLEENIRKSICKDGLFLTSRQKKNS